MFKLQLIDLQKKKRKKNAKKKVIYDFRRIQCKETEKNPNQVLGLLDIYAKLLTNYYY